MASGNGKIANIPREIREQLNWRINDDVPGIDLVKWLNSKPEVQAVLDEHYDGRPITEQNLSEWRKYGYQKWLALHTILDESEAVSEDFEEFAATGVNCEKLLMALTASYAEMIQRWNIIPAEQLIYKMGIFKNLTNAVMILRRAEIQAVRLEFERERLEILREKKRSKSASSSSSRKSSSDENTPPSDPAESTSDAQCAKPVPPKTPAQPAPPASSPKSASSETPSTPPPPSAITTTMAVTTTANAPEPEPGTPTPAPQPSIQPYFKPSTSSPRNPRGLL